MPSSRAFGQATATTSGGDVGERSTPISAVPEKKEQERDESEEFTHSATVQKIGRAVGLNPDQAATAFTILNFVVLLVLIGWIALKLLPATFRNRSSAIQKGLLDARTATEEANGRLKAVEDRLSKLDGEIASMREQAEGEAIRDEARFREALGAESAKILAAAETEIQAATSTARRDLQRHAAELAIEQAAQRLVISAETDRLLVAEFARTLGGDKGGQN